MRNLAWFWAKKVIKSKKAPKLCVSPHSFGVFFEKNSIQKVFLQVFSLRYIQFLQRSGNVVANRVL